MIRRVGALSLVGAMLAACAAGPAAAPVARERELVWADEFEGPAGNGPDPTRWVHDLGGHGWGNSELQCYTSSSRNARLDGASHLVIRAERHPGHRCADGTPNDFTSARITTRARFATTYGRIEMRAALPDGVGTWPAFWALGTDFPSVGWPRSGEIDVMEHVGSKPDVVSGTLHGPTATGEHWQLHRGTAIAGLGTSFHVFAAEWDRSEVTFSVDGHDYGQVRRTDAEALGSWPFDKPFYLLLNLAVGGTLGGPVPAHTVWPQQYVVDYVRIYR
jgi:beta-glucanase (GH16 family)